MRNIIETLNAAIDRASPNCHSIKRAMLINRALEHMRNRTAVVRKTIRGNIFAMICQPTESRDYDHMVSYSRLSACM